MLSEQETLQICRRYEITCPICGTENVFFRLKPDICRPVKTEGDGHPLSFKWGKPGFDSVDPKQFFWGVCKKCRFSGELDDADFRQAANFVEEYREGFIVEALRDLLAAAAEGKGIAQSLGKRIKDADPFGSGLAGFHLGILSQSLRLKIIPGNFARYYLRIGWLFRDQPTFYPDVDLNAVRERFSRLKKRWKRELPKHDDYPATPGMALTEVDALRFSRTYFERNYETLRQAKLEDELRLRQLLAEIGYRIYELSWEEEDFRKATTFFSGAMQQCMSTINDKSVVGGVVNRAKEMLSVCGDRGRELRELYKSRGGEGGGGPAKVETGRKKKSVKAAKDKAAAEKGARGNGKAEAAVKEAQAVPGDGERRELDQARRQVSLLQEEVGTLKGRVKELEEDNKKWRQLAGRDVITGLPNKNMLFRLALPKVLKNLKDTGPFSCIGIGLDQVAQVNQGHGWLMGDRMLKESAKSLRQFLGEGEELYRLDGVHFALVGPMSNNVARQRAMDMRRRLAQASVQVEETQFPLISSLGVVTVDRLAGGNSAEAASGIFEALLTALYRAKEKGGNLVEVHGRTKF